ncbi:MAG: NAD(P)-dependent oxidoreductase [Kiloniellales bacterium]
MNVGLIGVGAMGEAMAGHLCRKGHELAAYDIDPKRSAAVSAFGGAPVDSLRALAERAEIFIVMVATDAQSEAVVDALIAAKAAPNSLIAVAATNHPATMQRLARRAAEHRLRFIDAPVVFGLQGAQDGQLVSLCGGAAADVEFARPALLAYGRAVHHVGAVGAGQLAKACNNMMHWAACVASYEVLLLGKRFGIQGQRMREILLDCPARNGTLERWDATRFTWHEKDMDIVLELAQEAGLTLPLFGQIDQLVKLLGPRQVAELLRGPTASYLGCIVAPDPERSLAGEDATLASAKP